MRAVDDLSFGIFRGETIGLVGESGCGKTTRGPHAAAAGTRHGRAIVFAGTDVTRAGGEELQRYRREVQVIFQDPYSSLNPRMTIGQIIAEPLLVYTAAAGPGGGAAPGCANCWRRSGCSITWPIVIRTSCRAASASASGIARALALEPSFIVCDEPVSALDVSIQAQIINLLEDLQQKLGLTYLFIAHDLAVVRHIADRVIVMYLGRVMEIADRDALYADPLHPYTQALLDAVPIPDPALEARRRASAARRRSAQPAGATVRLCVSPALSAGDGGMQDGGAAAA